MYSPPANGYALVPVILVLNYGLNSYTALWKAKESHTLYGKKLDRKYIREENSDTNVEIVASWAVAGNHSRGR